MRYLKQVQQALIVNYIKIRVKTTKSFLQQSLVFSQFLICILATKALPFHWRKQLSFTIQALDYVMYIFCSASWQQKLQEYLGILGILLIKIREYSTLNTINTYTIAFSSWTCDRNTSLCKKF